LLPWADARFDLAAAADLAELGTSVASFVPQAAERSIADNVLKVWESLCCLNSDQDIDRLIYGQ
jgi:hypothetical protein